MTGVRTTVVIATRATTGRSASSSPSVTVVSRLSGKKTSQIVVACFQRGGAVRPAVDGVTDLPGDRLVEPALDAGPPFRAG